MIVYGTRSKLLAKELVTDKCPNCGTQNSTEIHIYQKWAHVFWIPFFPIGKAVASQCGHCQQVLKEKEMTSSMQSITQDVKSKSKTPIWTFSGLALLAVLIVYGVIIDKQKDEIYAAASQGAKERVKLVYRVKIDVDNPAGELKSNMPADAEIPLSR
jgi:phage FluMu protein Com